MVLGEVCFSPGRSQVEVFVHVCYHSKSTLGDTVRKPEAKVRSSPPGPLPGTGMKSLGPRPQAARARQRAYALMDSRPRPRPPCGEKDFVLPPRPHAWAHGVQWPLPRVTGVFSSTIILIRTQFPLRSISYFEGEEEDPPSNVFSP